MVKSNINYVYYLNLVYKNVYKQTLFCKIEKLAYYAP